VVSDVAWDREGSLCPIGWPDPQVLTQLFEHHVVEMLTSQRRLSREFGIKLHSWHYSGFQVYCGLLTSAWQARFTTILYRIEVIKAEHPFWGYRRVWARSI